MPCRFVLGATILVAASGACAPDDRPTSDSTTNAEAGSASAGSTSAQNGGSGAGGSAGTASGGQGGSGAKGSSTGAQGGGGTFLDGIDLDHSLTALPMCTTSISAAEIVPETGKAFVVTKNFGFRGDSFEDATHSPAELMEDDVVLGPAHALHESIRAEGAGRFSHWYNFLYFSSSDGSDPRTNGKTYAVRGPCHAPKKLETPLIATSTTGYATFQSHMQRMVSTRHGIFVTFLTAELPDGRRTFQFARSTDEGQSFVTLLEASYRTAAPAVEADESDNVYLFFSEDFNDASKPAFFYRFDAATEFANPTVAEIPQGSAGKFSALYDPVRQQFYYFTFWDSPHPNFYTIDKSGAVLSQTAITLPGPYARLQYPHLKRDGSRIYAAWTSQHLDASAPSYRSIHYIFSDDGCVSWNGPRGPIAVPAIGDETGPAPQIVLPDELEPITWLSNFLPRGQYAHFFYYASTPLNRQHYVRIDVTNGARTIDVYPVWAAGRLDIASLDGFFVDAGPTKPIFAVAKDSKNRIAVVASDDDGLTWLDYAVSDPVPEGYNVYSIGGAREPGPDGAIVGSYTEQDSVGSNHRVRFFRIAAETWD